MVGTKAGRLKLKKYFSEAERKHQAKNASKRWREKHSEEERVRHRGDRQRIVEWVNFIKNKPCMDCGQSFPPCVMDFDHRPGTEKIGSIAVMVKDKCTKEVIQVEIDKCDLVCANCHRIRTFITRAGANRR